MKCGKEYAKSESLQRTKERNELESTCIEGTPWKKKKAKIKKVNLGKEEKKEGIDKE